MCGEARASHCHGERQSEQRVSKGRIVCVGRPMLVIVPISERQCEKKVSKIYPFSLLICFQGNIGTFLKDEIERIKGFPDLYIYIYTIIIELN